jgi:hypothetical protein
MAWSWRRVVLWMILLSLAFIAMRAITSQQAPTPEPHGPVVCDPTHGQLWNIAHCPGP